MDRVRLLLVFVREGRFCTCLFHSCLHIRHVYHRYASDQLNMAFPIPKDIKYKLIMRKKNGEKRQVLEGGLSTKTECFRVSARSLKVHGASARVHM